MRVLLLCSVLLAPVFGNGSDECYERDENGNVVFNEQGEANVVTCTCDATELSNFVRHIGQKCFKNGQIPAEVWDGFYSGCPNPEENESNEQNGNQNQNGQEEESEECEQVDNDEAGFWCRCMGTYLNTYGSFPDGCTLPQLSEIMADIAGERIENVWEENNCEWFDYTDQRVLPEDVAVVVGDTGSFAVTTDQSTLQSNIAFSFNINEVKANYLQATGNRLRCNVDPNEEENQDNNNQEEEEDSQEEELELAWEIRRGWSYGSGSTTGAVTRYGDECSQSNTGDVLVSYVYPVEVDDEGVVTTGEKEVYIADMTENAPLDYADGVFAYPYACGEDDEREECQQGNANNGGDEEDDKQDSIEEQVGNLAAVFAYQLYAANDVDTYALVVSCQDEAQSAENDEENGDQESQESDECLEFDGEKDACEARVTKYGRPLFCTNFAVAFDGVNSDPDARDPCQPIPTCTDAEGNDLALQNPTQQECESSGYTWDSGESNCQPMEDDNGNGIPDEEEETNGFVLVNESTVVGKTVAIVFLSLAVAGLGFFAWTHRKAQYKGIGSAPGSPVNDCTPLAAEQL